MWVPGLSLTSRASHSLALTHGPLNDQGRRRPPSQVTVQSQHQCLSKALCNPRSTVYTWASTPLIPHKHMHTHRRENSLLSHLPANLENRSVTPPSSKSHSRLRSRSLSGEMTKSVWRANNRKHLNLQQQWLVHIDPLAIPYRISVAIRKDVLKEDLTARESADNRQAQKIKTYVWSYVC